MRDIYNNSTPFDSKRLSFKAGLSSKIADGIRNTDVSYISKKLTESGIDNNLRNNKMVAWCCDATLSLFDSLKKDFHIKLKKPQGLYVEDFQNLNINNRESFAFCNLFPSKLKDTSDKIYKDRTVFFNSFNAENSSAWNAINKISDLRYETGAVNTNHFLTVFIHEFVHCAHEDRLLKKHGEKKLYELILKLLSPENLTMFHSKHRMMIENEISKGASENPLELLAQDLTKRIIDSFNQTDFHLNKNPLSDSPYTNTSVIQRLFNKGNKEDATEMKKVLGCIWNGEFQKI